MTCRNQYRSQVVASMCVLANRLPKAQAAILSIAPQVDALELYTDADTDTRAHLRSILRTEVGRHLRVRIQTPKPLTDGWKFHPLALGLTRDQVFLFTCDDDLVYPPDYVLTMMSYVSPGRLVTAHGSYVVGDVTDFRKAQREGAVARALKDKPPSSYYEVNIPGTGCLAAWAPDLEGFEPWRHPIVNAADIHLGIFLQQQQQRRSPLHAVAVPHPEGWFAYLEPPSTIWSSGTGDSPEAKARRAQENELVASITWRDR